MDTRDAARNVPGRIAVFGNSNVEICIPAGGFPIAYEPSRTVPAGGIHVGVAGTAYNVGIGLWRLGHQVTLCVTQGRDQAGVLAAASMPADPRLRIIPLPVPRQPVTAVLLGPCEFWLAPPCQGRYGEPWPGPEGSTLSPGVRC
jgi:hypothetical protein